MDVEHLTSFNKYLDIVSLTITSSITVAVFYTLKFRLDKAAFVILSIYLMSMIIRVIQNFFQQNNNSVVLVLWPVSSNMIFTVLFYFVFEMEFVQAKIVSAQHTEYQQKTKIIKRERYATLATYCFIYIPQATIIYYLISVDLEWSREHITIIMSITVAGRILKIIIDVFMFMKFIGLFRYFVNKKLSFLKSRQQTPSKFNNFVIYWTILNTILKFLNSFFVLSVLTLLQYTQLSNNKEINSDFIQILYAITLRTMVTITDLFNCNTIIYLFYFQGQRSTMRFESQESVHLNLDTIREFS